MRPLPLCPISCFFAVPAADLLPRWRGGQDRRALQTSPGLIGVLIFYLVGHTYLAKVWIFGPLRWLIAPAMSRCLRSLVRGAELARFWRGNCTQKVLLSYYGRWRLENPVVLSCKGLFSTWCSWILSCIWTKSVMGVQALHCNTHFRCYPLFSG